MGTLTISLGEIFNANIVVPTNAQWVEIDGGNLHKLGDIVDFLTIPLYVWHTLGFAPKSYPGYGY